MAEKKKVEILHSPKGVAKWVNVREPQRSIKTKDGVKPVNPNYSVTLLLDPNDPETTSFVESLKKANDAGYAAAKSNAPKTKFQKMDMKIEDEQDKEGNLTGKLAIRFKCKAEGVRKDGTAWTNRPGVLDSKGNHIPKDVLIYGGSVVKVAFDIRHTAMPTGAFYTSFNLQAIRVYVLKSQSDRDAAYYGFAGEEEGYEVDGAGEPAGESFAAGQDANNGTPATGANF